MLQSFNTAYEILLVHSPTTFQALSKRFTMDWFPWNMGLSCMCSLKLIHWFLSCWFMSMESCRFTIGAMNHSQSWVVKIALFYPHYSWNAMTIPWLVISYIIPHSYPIHIALISHWYPIHIPLISHSYPIDIPFISHSYTIHIPFISH